MNGEIKRRVRLEPDLEEIAGDLNASGRRAMAWKLRRWARQLDVSATIIDLDSAPTRRPSLRPLARRRLLWN